MTSCNLGDSPQDDRSFIIERADFQAAVAAHRRAMKAPLLWPLAIATIGGSVGAWLTGIVYDDGRFMMAFFIGGWAVMIGGNIFAFMWYRRHVEKYGLTCTSCQQPLIEWVEWRRRVTRADYMLATRRCPACSAVCFEAEA